MTPASGIRSNARSKHEHANSVATISAGQIRKTRATVKDIMFGLRSSESVSRKPLTMKKMRTLSEPKLSHFVNDRGSCWRPMSG